MLLSIHSNTLKHLSLSFKTFSLIKIGKYFLKILYIDQELEYVKWNFNIECKYLNIKTEVVVL